MGYYGCLLSSPAAVLFLLCADVRLRTVRLSLPCASCASTFSAVYGLWLCPSFARRLFQRGYRFRAVCWLAALLALFSS
jgi:hypothetical protein